MQKFGENESKKRENGIAGSGEDITGGGPYGQ